MIWACSFLKCTTSSNRIYCLRYLARSLSKWSNPQEIRIPHPYGYIAAKTWGEKHHEPVLALHGWQDNAGTFDRIIPLLSQDLYIVAIDAPGHGLSPHLPPGTFYHYMQYLVDVKRIVDYLKWDEFSFIAHSVGGQIANLFSGIYADRVKNAVLLDVIKYTSYKEEELTELIKKNVEILFHLEQSHSDEPPVYTLEEARKRLIVGMYNQVTEDAADTLLKRGSRPSKCGKGVVFTKDFRLRKYHSLQPIGNESLKSHLQNVQCNLLIILGKDSARDVLIFRSLDLVGWYIDSYKKTCKSLKMVEVDGTHFVHLNNPERVAPLIDAFFKENMHSNESKT